MKIPDMPFTVTDWSQMEAEEYAGESGTSYWWTFKREALRVRLVEYSPDFRSDHWCARGHVLYVLEGVLGIELKNGQMFEMPAGTSFQAGDDESNPHLAWTEIGAKVFIVD
jgi:quercetin dioxygenase-like cupin family protein